ncbi:MAG TPA: hypothetical protein VKF37_05420 [Chloroflexota bacterium]|nr:hypothetical protein [Chloroflexota bacterium]
MKHGVHPKVASERRGQADMTLTLTTTGPVLPQMQQAAAMVASAVTRTASRERA